jgi:hypothetical protein
MFSSKNGRRLKQVLIILFLLEWEIVSNGLAHTVKWFWPWSSALFEGETWNCFPCELHHNLLKRMTKLMYKKQQHGLLGFSVKWSILFQVAESTDMKHLLWSNELNLSLSSWLSAKLKSNPLLLPS